MEIMISQDGTRIAFGHRGTSPPLVLVNGTNAADPLTWPAAPDLAAHFTLVSVQRRGRGSSGDGAAYALEREAEDVAAVVEAVADANGAPAHVLGHSHGGLCALEAALLTDSIGKLILYESAIHLPGSPFFPEGLIDRMEALLAAGDREGMLLVQYRQILSPDALERLRSSPAWAERLANVHLMPREMRAVEEYTFEPERFRDLHTPTLLLRGSDTLPFVKGVTAAVHDALPNSRVVVMPGAGHRAMVTVPELFARAIVAFLTDVA